MNSLLPPSSTALERSVDATAAQRLTPITPPHRKLFSPDDCPVELLHILAWSLGIAVWRESWPEVIKRQVIRTALDQHKQRGTVDAVLTAIRAFGAGINTTEWFLEDGQPHTFRVEFTPSPSIPSTAEFQIDVAAAIDAAKPLYAHYTLQPGLQITGSARCVAAVRATIFQRIKLEA